MATPHVIDSEVHLCEERAITQQSWNAKPYFAAVEDLRRLSGRARLVDASLADDLLDFLDQARDHVEEWNVPNCTQSRKWDVRLADRVAAIGTRLAVQLGMPGSGGEPNSRAL